MTGAQLALASGALISLGLVLAVWRLVPAPPHLNDVLHPVAPPQARPDRDHDERP